MQQDAEECCLYQIYIGGQVIHALSQKVKGLDEKGKSKNDVKFVDQFMTIEYIQE